MWVVLRKRAPKCDIELFALDLLVLVANRLVQCATNRHLQKIIDASHTLLCEM